MRQKYMLLFYEPVAYSVAANDGALRIGTITISGQILTVTQAAACTYSLSASSVSAVAAASNGTVNLITGTACTWAASSDVPWITVTSASGTGSGSVAYSVAANDGAARTGTLTISGQTLTVNQALAGTVPCSYTLSPSSVSGNVATATVNVTTTAGCEWTAAAASDVPWITVTPASGTDPGTVTYTIARNTVGAERSGTLTIGGQNLIITQSSVLGFETAATSHVKIFPNPRIL